MKIFFYFLALFILTNFKIDMLQAKNVTILATGGTIAGVGKESEKAKYASAQLTAQDLVNSIPSLEDIANIKTEQLISIGSQDMNDQYWLKIAKRVNKIISNEDVDSIVITHGTDTLEETAYFLNLTIQTRKPLILVGSMRSNNSLSSDGDINLYNAISLAIDEQSVGKGVLIVMADKIFTARDVSKTNSSDIDAFDAPNSGKIGHINYGQSQIYYQPLRQHTYLSDFNIDKISSLPKVDIIYMHSGFDEKMIDYLIDSGSQAIVIATVGNGNIYKKALPKLIKASKSGIKIIKSSRTGSGFVVPNVVVTDDEYGFISADNLNPQKARILTKLALTVTSDNEEIKEIFSKY